MDTMVQAYMEETEDMLQRAEECIIRLEMEYLEDDVNELFRIAHTIKGSSHMMGYEDIGNLMHSIEDMLDCTRNHSIRFNQEVVTLCFDGFDIAKKILHHKMVSNFQEVTSIHTDEAYKIHENIKIHIKNNKEEANRGKTSKEKQDGDKAKSEKGLIFELLQQKHQGKNRYYITYVIDEDAPMVSPIIMLILKTIEDIGSLVYSSVSDEYFLASDSEEEGRTFEVIVSTDLEEWELYSCFQLFYVDRINIINLTRSKNEMNDHHFCEADDTPYILLLKAIVNLYCFIDQNFTGVTMDQMLEMKQLWNNTNHTILGVNNKEKMECYRDDINQLFDLMMKLDRVNNEQVTEILDYSKKQIRSIIEDFYKQFKGRDIVHILKIDGAHQFDRIENYINTMNKSNLFILLVDISNLSRLNEIEVRDFLALRDDLGGQGIELGVINQNYSSRDIVNIFDSIQHKYHFPLYRSEIDAILNIFRCPGFYQRIMNIK